ncbi:ABC transporter ATP-binding protein [Bifidobacterium oedipodis]|uniref:Lipoprotein releasing system ATP-binding protein n=1 Tax=Bifidobacterium oedipodis TaxID=2675322 RepID=A0A7Y0HTH2_9BIFI|nr:ABC transporter ATP-binding protein [Bifidobacterium sp. DSM 109957]NMM93679.1 lipoprotein releasing system ATP-binding protein [Bifidobacterium sp. DSM 109957]
MDEADTVLSTEHLSASVAMGGKEVLRIVNDVSITIRKGSSYAIVGKSGSGKTSLISILGLLNAHYEGTLLLNGHDVATLSNLQRARLRANYMGFVFQNYSLIRQLNVWENVALPMEYAGHSISKARKKRSLECLERVGLAHHAKDNVRSLSGGEQQRVAIARALACKPKLIICDEPTGALDKDTGDAVMDLLLELVAADGCTLILVTHDADIAALCEQRFRMDRGMITPCSL